MGNKLSYPTVDLSGKVVVVTGGNTGIGYVTAKALAEMGAHTIIACRSQERATTAIDLMKQQVGEERELKVEYLQLDLASFQSTKDFIKTFKEKNLPLHILINNAAVAWVPFSKTDDGIESQFQVNHLSPMLLILELLPNIIETASNSGDGRIVFVSSGAHKKAVPFNPDRLYAEDAGQYDRLRTYPNTKLYNVMSAAALQRRLQNVSVTVSSLEPGYVKTELSRGWKDKGILSFINDIGYSTIARTPKEGAATTINCAVNPELNSQQHFYYDSCVAKLSSADSRNEGFQETLWRKSFDLLKDHLSPETIEKYGPTDEPQATNTTTEDTPGEQQQPRESSVDPSTTITTTEDVLGEQQEQGEGADPSTTNMTTEDTPGEQQQQEEGGVNPLTANTTSADTPGEQQEQLQKEEGGGDQTEATGEDSSGLKPEMEPAAELSAPVVKELEGEEKKEEGDTTAEDVPA